MNIFSSIFL